VGHDQHFHPKAHHIFVYKKEERKKVQEYKRLICKAKANNHAKKLLGQVGLH
jgi:hypothetical protein